MFLHNTEKCMAWSELDQYMHSMNAKMLLLTSGCVVVFLTVKD